MPKERTLIRRRFIPNETITLDDEVLYRDEDVIVTKWRTITRHHHSFNNGVSCYFPREGFKLSRFREDDRPLDFIYCDIIETVETEDTIMFADLLIDVLVYDDGHAEVLDLGEVSDALDEGLISVETAKKALRLADALLGMVYGGNFGELAGVLGRYE